MPLFYTITYQPGGQTEKFYGTAGRRYRVAGDDLIDLHSHPVWCFRCGKVTEGERIESVRELDEKIKNLERLAGEIRAEARAEGRFTHDEPADHVQQSDLAHLGQRRRWRVARQSPPRCLSCGSTHIEELRLDAPFSCLTSGTIHLSLIGIYDPTSESREIFSAEGELLA